MIAKVILMFHNVYCKKDYYKHSLVRAYNELNSDSNDQTNFKFYLEAQNNRRTKRDKIKLW